MVSKVDTEKNTSKTVTITKATTKKASSKEKESIDGLTALLSKGSSKVEEETALESGDHRQTILSMSTKGNI